MDLQAYRDAIYTWVSSRVPEGVTAYWDEPNAPRPDLPYARMKLIGPVRIGHDELRDIDADADKFKIVGPRSFTLRIEMHGKDVHQLIMDLQTSASEPDVQVILRKAGLAFGLETGIIDLTTLIDPVFEKRMQLEFTLLAHEDKDIQPGVIESIEGIGTVQGSDDYVSEEIIKVP